MKSKFQKRIGYDGEIEKVVEQVATDFGLGKYISHKVIEAGYEDFNLVVETEKEKYFIKMFATFRDEDGCRRYVDIMLTVLEAGVNHPKLHKSPKGYFYKKTFDGTEIRLVVMKYVDGGSLYNSGKKVNLEDARFLVQQAALISKIEFNVPFVYDSWAVVNFLKEWEENKNFFPQKDQDLVDPIAKKIFKT